MLEENKEIYNIGFQKKLEESEKLDKNLGRIMREIYNLNVVAEESVLPETSKTISVSCLLGSSITISILFTK